MQHVFMCKTGDIDFTSRNDITILPTKIKKNKCILIQKCGDLRKKFNIYRETIISPQLMMGSVNSLPNIKGLVISLHSDLYKIAH